MKNINFKKILSIVFIYLIISSICGVILYQTNFFNPILIILGPILSWKYGIIGYSLFFPYSAVSLPFIIPYFVRKTNPRKGLLLIGIFLWLFFGFVIHGSMGSPV